MGFEYNEEEFKILEYLKEIQIAIWLGDEIAYHETTGRCFKLIAEVQSVDKTEWDNVKQYLEQLSMRKNENMMETNSRILSVGNEPINMTYTLIALGSTNAEFRARVNGKNAMEPPAVLNKLWADAGNNNVSDDSWQWIDIVEKDRFTGVFNAIIPNGIIHGHITCHDFLAEKFQYGRLMESVAEHVILKLQNIK